MKVSERVALARAGDTPAHVVAQLLEDSSPAVRRSVAARRDLSEQQLAALARDPDKQVRRAVAEHPDATDALLSRLLDDSDFNVHWYAAQNPAGSTAFRLRVAEHHEKQVRWAIAQLLTLEEAVAIRLCADPSWEVREQLALVTPHRSVLDLLLVDSNPKVRGTVAQNRAATESDLRQLAADPKAATRMFVAISPFTPLDLLLKLVNDRSKDVRFWLTSQLSQPELLRTLLADPDRVVAETARNGLKTATGNGRSR